MLEEWTIGIGSHLSATGLLQPTGLYPGVGPYLVAGSVHIQASVELVYKSRYKYRTGKQKAHPVSQVSLNMMYPFQELFQTVR